MSPDKLRAALLHLEAEWSPEARAAVEALFAELTRERDEAREKYEYIQQLVKANGHESVTALLVAEGKAREALAQARRAEWQPIETAPKDGTYVLLAIDKKPLPEIASWFHGSGWEADNVFYRDDRCLAWMPLPQPPAQEGQ